MYDLIAEIINHVYQNNYSGDQQYIYYICGALIICLTLALIDQIFGVFRSFVGRVR